MSRVQFNDGQEIVQGDLNKITQLVEQELYDRVVYELLGRTTDVVFGNSFKVSYVNGTTVQVAAGVGFQNDSTQVHPEAKNRLLYLATATNKTLTTPDPTNPRIDLVCIKHNRANSVTESRRYKATVESLPTNQSFTVETDWSSDLLVVAGTPAGSPSAPAVPSGYKKIATLAVAASTGLAGSSSITDERTVHNRRQSATIANNTAAASITGLTFDGTKYDSARVTVSIHRKTDSGELKSAGELWLTYKPTAGTWALEPFLNHDDAGVTFSVTTTSGVAQVKYTSDSMAGTNYSGTLRFRAEMLDT